MAIIYRCDLCDRKAAIEVELRVSTPNGTPCRSMKKHLCDRHSPLVGVFENSLIPSSQVPHD